MNSNLSLALTGGDNGPLAIRVTSLLLGLILVAAGRRPRTD
jgi:hypothetical protein